MQASPIPCFKPLLLLQIFIIAISPSIKGTPSDEAYKGRKWTTGRDGHYSVVVSADDHELHPEESVGYALVLQEKKMGKTKSNEEMGKLLMDKYDKVTERLILKENRKRQRIAPVGDNLGNRKRRRNPIVASTTGLPQTMSYNLYNHFRPLEQDVPQDHILPFLDFGRKLSTGSTTSGVNSIELSSTPRISLVTTDEPLEAQAEEQLLDEMDLTISRKAVERNSPPHAPPPLKPKKSPIVSLFGEPPEDHANHKLVNINNENKTEAAKSSYHDLQPNESIQKPQIIISPDYGVRLNKTATANSKTNEPTSTQAPEPPNSTTIKTPEIEADSSNATESRSDLNEVPEVVKKSIQPASVMVPDSADLSKAAPDAQIHIVTLKDPHTMEVIEPLGLVKSDFESHVGKRNGSREDVEELPVTKQLRAERLPQRQIPDPSPTARILSTAVVTSVSVKESPRFPRGRNNHTTSEVHHRVNPMKPDPNHTPGPVAIHKNSSDWLQENRTDLLQNLSRRKFTTFRPKSTSTIRMVTFRNQFRRNSTSHIPAVVHVVSTPPSYIEVPRIAPVLRNRAQLGNFARKINPQRNAALTMMNQTTTPPSSTVSTTLEKQEEIEHFEEHLPSKPDEEELEVRIAPVLRNFSSADGVNKSPNSRNSTDVSAASEATASSPSTEPSALNATSSQEAPSKISSVQTTARPTSSTAPTTTTTANLSTTESPLHIIPSEESVTNLEIEFRPLDEVTHTSPPTPQSTSSTMKITTTRGHAKTQTTQPSTTPRPFNFSVPHIPDLLWVYGQRNNRTVKTQPSTVGVAFHDTSWGVATYVLVALGTIPLLLGTLILIRQILLRSKKKVLDESEYSSEYNRSPLPTKLPRLPAHINWDEAKPTTPAVVNSIPSSSVGSKWEFPRDKLRLQTVLGQGNFGQVWKAEADDISGHEGLTRLVAVKMVKEGASQREKEDLLRELAIMQELSAHPNVVTLLGCCTDKEPYLLIMEYVMYGKLLAFLREHRTRAHYFNFSDLSSALNSRDLTVFSYCVARGMEYLASKGIIHRDLAARNILVDHNKLCKIADFGMSRNVRDTGEIYEQRPNRGALPIRWMAPESLHYNLFTHKSDVWSFGVLLWEIITLGSTPYNTMGAREVMRQVLDGYRLEKPKHCKTEFFKVLAKCWHADPNCRPSFSELKSEIGALLGTTESEGRFVDLEAMTEEIIDQGH